MIQPRKLSEREDIFFILLFILMVVLLLGRVKRQDYDAAQNRPTQMDLKTFDVSRRLRIEEAFVIRQVEVTRRVWPFSGTSLSGFTR